MKNLPRPWLAFWGSFGICVLGPISHSLSQERPRLVNAPLKPGPLASMAKGTRNGGPQQQPPPTPPEPQTAPARLINDPYQPPPGTMQEPPLAQDPPELAPAGTNSAWGPENGDSFVVTNGLQVDKKHLFGLRVGPGWYVEDSGHLISGSPARLSLGMEYRYKLFQASSVALHLSVPAWLQLNPEGDHTSTFFGFNVGLQLEFFPRDHLAFFLRASTGAGSGIYGAEQPQSLGGVLTMVGAGVLLHVGAFHLGLEPLSLPILSPIGPNAPGTQVFASLNIYTGISW